ncbi:Nuclear AAA ATPase [Klebsormidium nitens]|uniref:Nuclear AAA ATPase n=1 Tax=Klebsormidium nitens TaxID=105231 RepID=A0A1Y1HV39_KLENI|nr:Nuclear AAA ATPase [Klebsormidium nitens]|eukprot:GAQ81059.1 Nuclear AAA ATPase [Klebsormidium nitens]
MGKSKGSRSPKPEGSPRMVAPPGGTAGNVSAPGLVGHSFEVAIIGTAPRGPTNGPARIYLSPTLMMAEAVGTGDLLAVGLLGSEGGLVNLTALHQLTSGQSASSCGDFFTLVDAWPSPKLPRDAARLSPPLADSLAQPPGGSVLCLFPLQKVDTLSGPDTQSVSGPKSTAVQSNIRAKFRMERCSNLQLRWCPPQSTDHTEPLPLPLSPLTPPSKGTPPSRPGIPLDTQSPQSPQTPNPHPQTPGLQAQNPLTPTPQTPRGRRPPQASPATPKGRNVSRGSASPSPSPLKRNQEEQPPPRMTEGQRAAVTSLLGDAKGRGVVETFAARWLAGRHLVEGNHVIIPLCGFNCTFQVLCPTASEAATSTPPEEPSFSFRPPETNPPLPSASVPPLVAFSVVGATKVSFLEPTESELDAQTRGEEKARLENAENLEVGEAIEKERVGYSELGGVGEQIKALRELVELPLRRPEMFRRYGIRPPRGVLLYGPPGTGKTLLARAAAIESGASMFVINGPEIVSAHYGESEEALRDVFAAAEKAAPSVIFIDELDAIAPARETGTEDMAQRMVAALLTLLDGGSGNFNRVIVIAATNRPESIDPALRRPGRFDRELEIGVPTPKGRLEILHTLLRGKRHSLRPSDVNTLAAATHGFVGADLAALCNEAALNALRRIIGARVQSAQSAGPRDADVRRTDVKRDEGLRAEGKCRIESAKGEVGGGNRSGEGTFGELLDSVQTSGRAEDTESKSKQTLENNIGATSSGESSGARNGQVQSGSDNGLESDVTARLSSLGLEDPSQNGDSAGLAVDSLPGPTSRLQSNPLILPDYPDRQIQRDSDSLKQLPSPSSEPASASRTPSTSAETPISHNPSNSLFASSTENPPSSANPPEPRNFSKPPCITLADFEAAQTKIRPSAMREVMIEVPRVRWADIGGQKATKQKLQETVEWPQKHPEAFSRVGAQAPRGVLLYGPPGCSKTLMARAVATEAGLNFLAVKGPELFSKWVGESEKAVRALFARARASSPSIIFFDEIDGLAATRDDGSTDGGTGVSERVMSQLLTELDGLSPLAGVAIIGATNRPDIIDPALLRPGRFDRMLFVSPPDCKAREQIFGICLRATPCDAGVRVEDLAERTEKYTGADIAAVCREAALAALEEDLSATSVKPRHFDAALKTVGPSISPHDETFYASFQRG